MTNFQDNNVNISGPFLLPATKLRQGNAFTPVCHSVHRGVSATPPGKTPTPLGRHPSPSACWDTHTLNLKCAVYEGLITLAFGTRNQPEYICKIYL